MEEKISRFSALLEKLCGIHSAPNFEDEMRAFLKEYAEPLADDFFIDDVGSVYILKKGRKASASPIVLWNALDEPAFLVKSLNDDGSFTFEAFDQCISAAATAGKVLRMARTGAKAIVPLAAIHLTPKSQRGSMPDAEELFGELGTDKKEQSEETMVRVGDFAVFETPYRRLGRSAVSGRAIGRRIGCAITLRMLEETPEIDTWFVFGTKAEISAFFSAELAVRRLKPAFAVTFECADADDMPAKEKSDRKVSLRKGSVLHCKSYIDRKTLRQLIAWADDTGTAYQLCANARVRASSAFAESPPGCPVIAVGVAERHRCSAFPIADLGDALEAEAMVREALRKGGELYA